MPHDSQQTTPSTVSDLTVTCLVLSVWFFNPRQNTLDLFKSGLHFKNLKHFVLSVSHVFAGTTRAHSLHVSERTRNPHHTLSLIMSSQKETGVCSCQSHPEPVSTYPVLLLCLVLPQTVASYVTHKQARALTHLARAVRLTITHMCNGLYSNCLPTTDMSSPSKCHSVSPGLFTCHKVFLGTTGRAPSPAETGVACTRQESLHRPPSPARACR